MDGLREKVIRGLEICLKEDANMCETICPYFHQCGAIYENNEALMKDALTLLKAQEPRVMTLEEVKSTKTDGAESRIYLEPTCEGHFPVWLEYNYDFKYPEEDDDDEDPHRLCAACLGKPLCSDKYLEVWSMEVSERLYTKNYNKEWRCWTSRPTDEQREAVKWNE